MDFLKATSQKPKAYSLVDVGQDTIKAVIAWQQTDMAELEFIGYGLAEAGGHDITGGRLEAEAIMASVNIALSQAEDYSQQIVGQKIVPDEVIFSLPGRATMGELFIAKQVRPRPTEPISAKELANLHQRVERMAQQLVKDGTWQLLTMLEPTIRLDDQIILRALARTGREISISRYGLAVQ